MKRTTFSQLNTHFQVLFYLIVITIFTLNCQGQSYFDKKGVLFEKRIWAGDSINKIELKSQIIRDTLVGKWKNETYGFPIIKDQTISFWRNNTVFKEIPTPIPHTTKSSVNQRKIYVVTFPIIEICILAGVNCNIYFIYGADFCNGIGCPEFYGLYDFNGNCLFQGITTEMNQNERDNFKLVLSKYSVDINKRTNCQSIMDIWK